MGFLSTMGMSQNNPKLVGILFVQPEKVPSATRTPTWLLAVKLGENTIVKP